MLLSPRIHAPFRSILFLVGGIILHSVWVTDKEQPMPACERDSKPAHSVPDTCPWQLVMSELTHRLRLLELTYKDQVLAREVMEAEVSNQSSSKLEMERKMEELSSSLLTLSSRVEEVNDRVTELSTRVHSDECLGFLILLFVMLQLILLARANIVHKRQQEKLMGQGHARHNGSAPGLVKSFSNNVFPAWPSSLKNQNTYENSSPDLCVIAFSRSSKMAAATSADAVLRPEELATSSHNPQSSARPVYIMDSREALRQCPKARIYFVFFQFQEEKTKVAEDTGSETTSAGTQQTKAQREFWVSALRWIKAQGGYVFLVIAKEVGSKNLASPSLYNSSLPLLQSNEALQELASNGMVLSIWENFTSHQLTYARRMLCSVLESQVT